MYGHSLFSDPVKITKLQSCDFALFASAWWPRAPKKELQILAYLSFWLFVWDDEIDEATGTLSDDFEASERYRQNTVAYITETLGLTDDSSLCPQKEATTPLNEIIGSFGVIGKALKQVYNIEQRKRFLREMEFFIQKSQLEQKSRLDGCILSLDEYWDIRMGTSAVGVIMAVNEFSARANISDIIMDHPDMRTIWDESNINVSIVNDLLSLKKEISKGAIDSLIPILCANTETPQSAIGHALKSLKESIARFDTTAWKLLNTIDAVSPDKLSTYEFIQDCRFNCSGNLYWSLRTERYGMGDVPKDLNGNYLLEF
ncbi:isoprenoid synthase domain-containing protein [Trichoderma pleuroticola]